MSCCHVGDGPDDREHVIEFLHTDFAVDDGDPLLAGLLGESERGDGAAEQQQRLGHVLAGGLESPLVPAPRPGEQRAHVLLEHGEGNVGQPGLKAGGLGHEHGCSPRRFQIGHVLHRHDRPFADQAVEAVGMDSPGVSATDPQAARVFEAVEQRGDIGGGGRLRVIPQPGETGAAEIGIDHQQLFECFPLGGGQAVRQGFENLLPGTRPPGQPDPLQHRYRGEEHVVCPQMGDHRPDDRLPAVGGPGCIRARPQAGAPIGEPEAAKLQIPLKLDRMFPARLVPERVVTELGRWQPELMRYEGYHLQGRMLARPHALAGMAQEAQLDGEPEPIDRAPLCPDEGQVVAAQHVVPRHLGGIGWNSEQPSALLGRQEGTTRHDGLCAR